MASKQPDTEIPLPRDGRRERSYSSRAKIIAAMLDLVGSGDYSPSAARVAKLAGVGQRSVFRHFQDMDALYREMSEVVDARVKPIYENPPTGDSWKDKLVDIADRRARVFETILHFRISGSAKRYQSAFLMQDYRRMLIAETAALEAQLPPAIKADQNAARGLDVILSFQTWRLLRHDQELPESEARAVVRRLLDDALARLPDLP